MGLSQLTSGERQGPPWISRELEYLEKNHTGTGRTFIIHTEMTLVTVGRYQKNTQERIMPAHFKS